jgi:hypothetical protein
VIARYPADGLILAGPDLSAGAFDGEPLGEGD